MSRIGKKIIVLPQGVEVKVDGNKVVVKGGKGQLSQIIDDSRIAVKIEGNEVSVTRSNDEAEVRSKHGLYRALIANMVKGVSEGYVLSLLINGVGYKAAINGSKLTLNIGFSHPIEVIAPEGIEMSLPQANEIMLSSIDKEKLGHFAASIRSLRKPEPYHGYGIQYKTETVQRKEGKAAGKK